MLVVRTTSSGDWSTYVLAPARRGRRAASRTASTRRWPGARSRFTVDCPQRPRLPRAPDRPPRSPSGSPLQDYLARDYEALRTRLLDRLSTLLPRWTDRSPADPACMLVELFAYLGDRLAYWQDAVAVEAYLGTARRRTSVRRHARLLDYRVHEGCSARALAGVRDRRATTLPAGAAVADIGPAAAGLRPVDVHDLRRARSCSRRAPTSTCAPARNGSRCTPGATRRTRCRPGATCAFLAAPERRGDPGLRAGDVLVLADSLPAGRPDRPDR